MQTWAAHDAADPLDNGWGLVAPDRCAALCLADARCRAIATVPDLSPEEPAAPEETFYTGVRLRTDRNQVQEPEHHQGLSEILFQCLNTLLERIA